MALITSDCGATRFLGIKWSESPRVVCPQSNGVSRAEGFDELLAVKRRRDSHSAAPPSAFSRRFNRDGEGVSAK